MLKLTMGNKELKIYFAYTPSVQSNLLSKLGYASDGGDENENTGDGIKRMEDIYALIPEMLLVGLQKHHKDEFGYKYRTGAGKEEQLEKVDELFDEYMEGEDANAFQLYQDLMKAFEDDFLSKAIPQDHKEKQTEQKPEKK